MSVRDVGKVGWSLVAATVVLAIVFFLGAVTGILFRPPWDLVAAGLGLALPAVLLATVWYLFDVAWAREIRAEKAGETQEIEAMGTAEALLRALDHATGLLDRLTKYTGRFFVLVLTLLLVLPLLFSFELVSIGSGGFLGIATTGFETVIWILYFYSYYRVKHENDLWKERIAWLRKREESLIPR